jgi:acyl-CoA thioesterase
MSTSPPLSDRSPGGFGSAFDRDVPLVAQADGTFTAAALEGWDGSGRVHGGVLAAQMLMAMSETVDDPTRQPRSLTSHFVRPPSADEYTVACVVERSGRTVSNVSARVKQAGSLVAMAMAAFATERRGPDFDELPMPDVAPPTPARQTEAFVPEFSLPFSRRIIAQQRLGLTPLSSPDGPMQIGGWLGFADPRPLDGPGLLVLCDAAMMPWWIRLPEIIPTATLDYTVHFRADLPRSDPHELVFCQFETRLVRGGLLDWDAVAWAPDGTVLCLARQQLVSLD